MQEAWIALTRYKMLEERVRELKTKAWISLPPNDDIDTVLDQADKELAQLKTWIEINYKTTKAD